MGDPDFERVVAAARAGDRGAFEQLVARFQDMAVALCYGRLGNRELAREAAQEAFVDAFVHLSQLSEPAAFAGWFRRVLLKHCDRSTRRRQPAPALVAQHAEQSMLDAEGSLLAAERERWLWAAVEALPEHERTAVALYYLADQSVAQIGAVLEVPVNTIKQRLHAARRRIREESMNQISETLASDRPSSKADFSAHVRFFLAIRAGDAEQVRELLKHDPSLLEAEEGWSAIDWPDRDLPVAERSTPLIRAAERGKLEVVRALLDAGAHVDGGCGCRTSETPLWAAVVTHQLDAARELLTRGADPNARASSGVGCLHAAALRGHADLVALLLQHGADPHQRDREGRTAADWARIKGHPEILSQFGAPAARTAEQTRANAPQAGERLYATGIKAIDLFAPLSEGAFALVHGGMGVGRNVLVAELASAARLRRDTASIWVMWPREVWSDSELDALLNETQMRDHVQLVWQGLDAGARDNRARPAHALALAERLLQGQIRHVQLTFFERPGVRTAIEALIPALGARGDGTSIGALVVPPWQLADQLRPGLVPPFDAYIGFDPAFARAGIFPAIDAQASDSRLLRGTAIDSLHRSCATRARTALADLAQREASAPDDPAIARAALLRAYLSQPFTVAEPFSGLPGTSVELPLLLRDVAAILDGKVDHLAAKAIRYGGALQLER